MALLVVSLFLILCSFAPDARAETVADGSCGANLTWTLDHAGVLTVSGTGPMKDFSHETDEQAPWKSHSRDIKSVIIKNGVTSIGNIAFYYCSNLTSVTIPEGVTSIGHLAFDGCSGLTTVTIPGSVTSFGHSIFTGCTGLQSVTFAEGITSIPAFMFSDCSSLRSVYIPESVTDIGVCAFFGCSSLETINIPEGVTFISYCLFQGCTSLTTVTIPDSVTLFDMNAFAYCSSLTTVVLPDSLTSIGEFSFAECTALKTVHYTGTETQWAQVVVNDHNEPLVDAVKHYNVAPDSGCVKNYFCPTCNDYVTEPEGSHSFEDGVCAVCGAEDPQYVFEKFDVAYARMILGNELKFQFAIAQTARDNWTGAYAVIEKEWADGTVTTKTIPSDAWKTTIISGAKHWVVIYDMLAAKEMSDYFYVTIYSAAGEPLSNTWTDSVRVYVARAFGSQSDKGKTMMVDMLYYGAAAQQKFNYGTDSLATAMLTNVQKAFATKEPAPLNDNQIAGPNYKGARLVLTSRIQMQLAFSGLTEDMYATYTFTDKEGNVQNIRVEGTGFVNAGSLKGIELNALVYADARAVVTVTVYNANGSVYGLAMDSIESYTQRTTDGNDVFAYLMNFADSARAYLCS